MNFDQWVFGKWKYFQKLCTNSQFALKIGFFRFKICNFKVVNLKQNSAFSTSKLTSIFVQSQPIEILEKFFEIKQVIW